MRRTRWTVTLLAALVFPAVGKQIDLSTRSDQAGIYEIGFCARPSPNSSKGWPGHAFVSFSQKKPDGSRDFTALGHTLAPSTTAAGAAWSLFGPAVSGMLKEEVYTSVMQNCLIVIVNREDYEKGLALTQSPLAKLGLVRGSTLVFQAYKLGAEDCVSWMIGVARLLEARGLKVPARGTSDAPMPYMQRLVDAN